MVMIAFHGGKCCGIKTICHLGTSPEELRYARTETEVLDRDACGDEVTSSDDFFHLSRPEETAGERFKACVEYLKRRRPKGLVEVTIIWEELANSLSQKRWKPVLLEHGFKLAAEYKNSNSGNTLRTYLLVMDEEGETDEDGEIIDPFDRW